MKLAKLTGIEVSLPNSLRQIVGECDSRWGSYSICAGLAKVAVVLRRIGLFLRKGIRYKRRLRRLSDSLSRHLRETSGSTLPWLL